MASSNAAVDNVLENCIKHKAFSNERFLRIGNIVRGKFGLKKFNLYERFKDKK